MSPELATEPIAPARRGIGGSARTRCFELALVLFIAFSRPILSSAYIVIHGMPTAASVAAQWHFIQAFREELGALLLLAYGLHRSGRSFHSLGKHARVNDLFSGMGLVAGSWLSYYVSYIAIQIGYRACAGTYLTPPDVSAMFSQMNLTAMPFFLLNPFYEEFIVRGYLMTEVAELSGSTVAAVLASAALQTAYHLYQGWLLATCLFFGFLIFSVYYARTRRLFPVLVAHAACDWLLV
jgi:membrane protease YdiL (CAAX protease family)